MQETIHTAIMQASGFKDIPMDTTSPPDTSPNNFSMDTNDATRVWATCLAEGKDEQKYPRAPVIEGPFKNFDEMWDAKAKGNHNPREYTALSLALFIRQASTPLTISKVNTFQRPTGPTHREIALLQNLHRQGMSLDQISAFLVVTFPDLMKGWKTGTEYDRRLQIHGLVNLWTSIWAPQVKEDGSIDYREDIKRESDGYNNMDDSNTSRLPQWMKEQLGTFLD